MYCEWRAAYEDNCESLGCYQDEELMGNFGIASTTSSFIGHHFSTIEGGYVFTDDDELAAMLKVVRAHGWTRNLGEDEIKLLNITRGSDFENPYTLSFAGSIFVPVKLMPIVASGNYHFSTSIMK